MVARNGIQIEAAEADSAVAEVRGTIRVWLVDDSENFRELLAAMLDDEGGLQCERQFSTAEEVLEALKSDVAPDAILLDVRMPGMGGLEAVRFIRDLAADTRILMLTTFGNMDARKQALRDGASDFLLKSYQIGDIAQRVREACARPLETREALEPAAARDVQEWPNRRASGGACVPDESARIRPLSESGRRKGTWDGDCGSNRLMRGVRFLRGWLRDWRFATRS